MSTVVADPWKLLLQDFVFELMDDVKELKAQAPCDDSFDLGRRTAFYELLDRLRQQVEAFGLNPSEIGLSQADLDREIL